MKFINNYYIRLYKMQINGIKVLKNKLGKYIKVHGFATKYTAKIFDLWIEDTYLQIP